MGKALMFKKILSKTDSQAVLFQPLEIELISHSQPENEPINASLEVTIEHQDGCVYSGEGFCNGGGSWMFRFSPLLTGKFTWRTRSQFPELDDQKGELVVEKADSDNIFLKHGPLKIAKNKRTFAHYDGTPFFWLGEGLWAVAQQAQENELDQYFSFRKKQGFSVAQFNTLLNWESTIPYHREPFQRINGKTDLDRYNDKFFNFLDLLFEKCALNGFLAVPVVLWFNYLPGKQPDWYDPPFEWPVFDKDQAYRYGKFLGARYGAYPVFWLVTADIANDAPEAMEVVQAAVRGLQEASFHNPIISAHFAARSAYHPGLVQQDWFSFYLIQSGHRKDGIGFPTAFTRAVRTQCVKKPVVNGEMFFENLGFTKQNEKIPVDLIRRAAWESFLAGANAGISYGSHGIWCWYREGLEFRMEYLWQKPMPWEKALLLPGPKYYQILKEFLIRLPWQDLEEAHDLPVHEGGQEPAIACRLAGGRYVLVYIPARQRLRLTDIGLLGMPAKWFDPENAEMEEAKIVEDQGGVTVNLPSWQHDAVLLIGPTKGTGLAE